MIAFACRSCASFADWCAGVVLGFGLASGHIRGDEQELIEHLQDVAAVEFEDSDNDEEGEKVSGIV
jgi:uncharacterized protein YgfB (UPF0149 family)